jgi:transposase
MNHTATRQSKAARKRNADERKAALVASGHVYKDLARLANVSYSMVDKWMNGLRSSKDCARAFETLTNGKSS